MFSGDGKQKFKHTSFCIEVREVKVQLGQIRHFARQIFFRTGQALFTFVHIRRFDSGNKNVKC